MTSSKLTSKLIGLSKEIIINYDDKKALLDDGEKYWKIIEWVDQLQSFLLMANPQYVNNNPLVGKRWAITSKGFKETIDLSKLLIEKYPDLEYSDFRDLCEYAVECLKNTAYSESLYDIMSIKRNKACRLFEVILPDPLTWATNVLDIMQKKFEEDIEDILLLFSLPCRINSDSFHLGYQGLRLVNINDKTVMQELADKYSLLDFTSKYFDRWDNPTIRDSLQTETFIAFERKCNKNNVFEYGKEFTDYFLSVLMAHNALDKKCKIWPSMKETKSVVITCFTKSSRSSQKMRIVDNPLFYPVTEILITSEILLNMRKWWTIFDSLCSENQSKIKNGLSFYIKGLSGTEISQFTNLYLFIDSVYGVNGKVENSIKNAILKKLPNYPDALLGDFWSIRCDILHGGINRLHKWKGFPRFLREYSVDPIIKLNNLCNEIICSYIY